MNFQILLHTRQYLWDNTLLTLATHLENTRVYEFAMSSLKHLNDVTLSHVTSEACSEPGQTPNIERFAKLVNDF